MALNKMTWSKKSRHRITKQVLNSGKARAGSQMCPKCRKSIRNSKFNRHMKQEHEGGTL